MSTFHHSADPMDMIYSRRDRRRLARSDSGPGRRFGRRVSRARPSYRWFTRVAVEDLAVLAVSGVRRRDVEIQERAPMSVIVQVPAFAVRHVRDRLEDIRPVFISLQVVASETIEAGRAIAEGFAAGVVQ